MEKVKSSVDLVAFQKRLNANLEDAASHGGDSSLLGFRLGGKQYVIDLQDLREVEGVPSPEQIVGISLAKDWVLGISNFKGYIYTLVDFQKFLTGIPTTQSIGARVLVVHQKYLLQMAIVVPEIIGLIAKSDLEEKEVYKNEKDPWRTGKYVSKDGSVWELLSIKELTEAREMMDIELV